MHKLEWKILHYLWWRKCWIQWYCLFFGAK